MEPLNVARERQARSKENNPKPSAKVALDVSLLLYNALITAIGPDKAAIGRAQP